MLQESGRLSLSFVVDVVKDLRARFKQGAVPYPSRVMVAVEGFW